MEDVYIPPYTPRYPLAAGPEPYGRQGAIATSKGRA